MTLLGSRNASTALELEVGRAMREAADSIILPAFAAGSLGASQFKTPGELVTDVDRRSEAYLVERLMRILPEANVVGEEAAHQDPALLRHLAHGTCWIVDPLDGTGNFAAGKPPFGILIALASNGLPIAGWLLDPVTGRLCTATAECGARIDAEPFRCVRHDRPSPLVGVTTLFSEPAHRAVLMERLARDHTVQDAPRCAADLYPGIVTGTLDAALFTRTIAWDHAAGVLFLNEAGGYARRPDGTQYHCGDPTGGLIAASSAARWHIIAGQIAELDLDWRYSPPPA